MGVYFLQRQAMKRLGAPCTRVKMRVKVMRGEFSGGTVASLMNVVKEAAAEPALRKDSLTPIRCARPGVRQMCGNPTSDRRNSMSTSAPGLRRS